MPTPNLPADLRRQIAELRDRLTRLETADRLASASTRGGTVRFLAPDGTTRWTIGTTTLDGRIGGITSVYGVVGQGDLGEVVYMQAQGTPGRGYPTQPVAFHAPTTQAVTSATFVATFEGGTEFPPSDVLRVVVPVQTAADTTGEIRLADLLGGHTTDPLTLPTGTNGTAVFTWVHPSTVGLYDTRGDRVPGLRVTIQARRTAGTGSVTITAPTTAEMTTTFLYPAATTTGNPTLG